MEGFGGGRKDFPVEEAEAGGHRNMQEAAEGEGSGGGRGVGHGLEVGPGGLLHEVVPDGNLEAELRV
ncbi:hypothetical protein Sjap_012464 [Stephania japonica]|uniref:Uncharacterized protein n=1 Tax=Stephania japonica TaxID=461633 RepID=A0AAP0IVZ7_9MAGN